MVRLGRHRQGAGTVEQHHPHVGRTLGSVRGAARKGGPYRDQPSGGAQFHQPCRGGGELDQVDVDHQGRAGGSSLASASQSEQMRCRTWARCLPRLEGSPGLVGVLLGGSQAASRTSQGP